MKMCPSENSPNSSDPSSTTTTTIAMDQTSAATISGSNAVKAPDTTSRNPNRRSNKPIMEKRRRARINNCLNELKAILLEAMRKDPARHSKLEKADILELTVSHLKELHRASSDVSSTDTGSINSKYRAGYLHCISEVERYLTSSSSSTSAPSEFEGVIDSSIVCRLLAHLADSLVIDSNQTTPINNENSTNMLTSPNNDATTITGNNVVFSINGQSESVCEVRNSNNNSYNQHQTFNHNKSFSTPTNPMTTSPTTTTSKFNISAETPIISLVPSRLPSGQLAFIVPANFQQEGVGNQNLNLIIQQPYNIADDNNNCGRTRRASSAQQHHLHHHPYQTRPMSLSPELPLELVLPSSSSSLTNYRQQHRSANSSPSSSTSSLLSSPLSPTNNGNLGYQYHPYQLNQQQQHQYQYSNIQPAHYQYHHNQQEYYHKSSASYYYDDDLGEGQQPLALVKIKHEKVVPVDLSCWRPW